MIYLKYWEHFQRCFPAPLKYMVLMEAQAATHNSQLLSFGAAGVLIWMGRWQPSTPLSSHPSPDLLVEKAVEFPPQSGCAQRGPCEDGICCLDHSGVSQSALPAQSQAGTTTKPH